MIAHLRGTVLDRLAGAIVVDVAGVGYEVHASAYTLATVGAVGSQLSVRVYTHYTDNKITLFGFASAEERALFDLLITVKNVGPASAIKILSAGAGPIEIARLIASDQLGALKSIKGVGKKTAELLIVELRDKCEGLLMSWGAGNGDRPAVAASEAAPAASDRPPILDDVATALIQLGWKPAEADKAVATLPLVDGASLEGLLRQALRAMPR